MKKSCLLIILLLLNMHPHIKTSNTPSEPTPNGATCTVPGINLEAYFPFGQKSDDFKLKCVQDGYSKFEIISQKLPIDRDDIHRYALAPISLQELLGDTLNSVTPFLSDSLKEIVENHDKVTPKILYFKKSIYVTSIPNAIVGVELCFENPQKTSSALSRIALFFVQKIATKEDKEIPNATGINHLTLYNASENIQILNTAVNTENIINTIFEKLIAAYKNKIPNFLLTILNNKVTSIGKNQFGLILEKTEAEQSIIDKYSQTYGLKYIPLADHNYLFYKSRAELQGTYAEKFIASEKNRSVLLNSNYDLYGRIMGYSEADILFKYQFEEYLRNIKKVNSDGTIAWPYDIRKHKENFNTWLEKTWNSTSYMKSLMSYLRTPAERRKYENDKKKTLTILNQIEAEYKKEGISFFEKAKKLPEERDAKKVDTILEKLHNVTKKLDLKSTLQLTDKLQSMAKENEQKKGMLLYKSQPIIKSISKYSSFTPIKIKEEKSKDKVLSETKAIPKQKDSGTSSSEPLPTKFTEKVTPPNISQPEPTKKPSESTIEPEQKETFMNKAGRYLNAINPTKFFVYTDEEEEISPSQSSTNKPSESTSPSDSSNTSENEAAIEPKQAEPEIALAAKPDQSAVQPVQEKRKELQKLYELEGFDPEGANDYGRINLDLEDEQPSYDENTQQKSWIPNWKNWFSGSNKAAEVK